MTVYYLGIFGDFFHWLATFFGNIVQTITKYANGLNQMISFLGSGFTLIINITGWLPAIFATLIVLSIAILVIKFVLGR